MKKYFILYLFFFIPSLLLFSQNYNMGSTRIVTSGCGATIYDNGGTGNYGANRNDTITIKSADPANPFVEVRIDALDIHESDTLFIYNSDVADPTKLVFMGPLNAPWINNTNMIIVGDWTTFATINNPSGAITLRFKSNGANQTGGFKIAVLCRAACQRINAVIDPAACIPPLVEEDGIFYANICEYQTLTLSGYGDYYDNDIVYHQMDDSTLFTWELGDTTLMGVGLSTISHYYQPGRGYDVVLFLRDQRNCVNQNSGSIRVRTSLNPIRNISPLPDVCSGTNVNLSVGYNPSSSIIVDPVESIQESSLSFDSIMFIPDGPNCTGLPNCYNTNVTFTSFMPGQTLTDVNDLLSICMTIEHSYLGDLQFRIVCPNGFSTITHAQPNGGSLHLGVPIDDYGGCTPNPAVRGQMWNYCWSENTQSGYTYHGSSPNYLHQGQSTRCDSTNRQNNTNYYRPMSSFSSLIGCRLNGVWSIEICDLYGVDDGWISSWELNLSPNLLPTPWTYTVLLDEVLWSGPMISSTSDTTAIIQTPEAGVFDYTFTVIDEYGCAYDSTLSLNVVQSPIFDLGEDINICEGQLIQVDPNYNVPNAIYAWSDFTNDPMLTTTVPGNYCLTITQSNGNITCQSSDCIDIDIFTQPTADFSAIPTEGCSPLLVQFTDMTTPTGVVSNYYWDFGDPNTTQNTSNETNPNHIFANYGLYDISLRVVTEHGCESEIIKPGFITVHATPIANFIPSQTEVSLADNPIVEFTNTTENYSPTETSWTWSFGDGNGSAEHSPTHTYTDPEDYSVVLIVTTDKGCGDTVSRVIIVEDDIFIPNIITPDGDGVNDVLVIGNINPQRINTLKIYNRWGKKVYDQTNYKTRARCKNVGENAWDCSDYQGLDLGWGSQGAADGVYYYVFTYMGVTKEVLRNGTITVIGNK